jgi:hypothetical protein
MADIVLETTDLDVFGGPTSIDVSVDFGVTGTRGSRIWAGSGDPTTALSNQPVLLYDYFINTNQVDPFYGWLYQYIIEIGSPQWVRVLRLNPSQYSTKIVAPFTTGSSTVRIPITLLTADEGTLANRFTIRFNIEDTVPVASSFTYSIDTNNNELVIVVRAASWNGTTWSNINGVSKTVHFFVSYLA